jgi:hypothetical protein
VTENGLLDTNETLPYVIAQLVQPQMMDLHVSLVLKNKCSSSSRQQLISMVTPALSDCNITFVTSFLCTADQRHQFAVRRDQRPVRNGRRQGPPSGRAQPAAGDRDCRGHRRGRGRRCAGLLGVPAGLPAGRARQAAARMPARFPRTLH